MGLIEVRPLSGTLGAELSGVDLSAAPSDEVVAEIRAALLRYGVVCLRDQKLSREGQLAFAKRLGEPEVHPIADGMTEHPEIIRVLKPAGESAYFGTSWHTDNSFFEKPSAITVLYGESVPPHGGDTLYASMESPTPTRTRSTTRWSTPSCEPTPRPGARAST
jgi:taurine dioxygenase